MAMVATKIWFNPHNIVPQLGPDNVIELKLQLRLHDVTPFHSMNLKNLERLHIKENSCLGSPFCHRPAVMDLADDIVGPGWSTTSLLVRIC